MYQRFTLTLLLAVVAALVSANNNLPKSRVHRDAVLQSRADMPDLRFNYGGEKVRCRPWWLARD